MRWIAASAALMLSAGCGPGKPKVVDDQTFALEFATTYCDRMEECLEGAFYSEFLDQDDCIRETAGIQDDNNDLADDLDCDFEVDEAQQCATATYSATCEQIYENFFEPYGEVRSEFESCLDIYDC